MVELLRRPAGEAASEEEIKNHPRLKGDVKDGRLLYEEYTSVMAGWRTLEAQLEERRAEWASSQELIKQYSATLPLVERRPERL
ncbi:MAG: hypothetical protein LBS31_01045 [Candidatus Adiutrix sp.]|nr:hypothetical protein [Candidatus Adiutrix sp.]